MKYHALVIGEVNGQKNLNLEGPYASSEIQKEKIRQMMTEGKEVYFLDTERNDPDEKVSVGRVLMIERNLNS